MGPDVGYSWITGPVRRLGVAGPVAGMESWMGWDRNLYLGWMSWNDTYLDLITQADMVSIWHPSK